MAITKIDYTTYILARNAGYVYFTLPRKVIEEFYAEHNFGHWQDTFVKFGDKLDDNTATSFIQFTQSQYDMFRVFMEKHNYSFETLSRNIEIEKERLNRKSGIGAGKGVKIQAISEDKVNDINFVVALQDAFNNLSKMRVKLLDAYTAQEQQIAALMQWKEDALKHLTHLKKHLGIVYDAITLSKD